MNPNSRHFHCGVCDGSYHQSHALPPGCARTRPHTRPAQDRPTVETLLAAVRAEYDAECAALEENYRLAKERAGAKLNAATAAVATLAKFL